MPLTLHTFQMCVPPPPTAATTFLLVPVVRRMERGIVVSRSSRRPLLLPGARRGPVAPVRRRRRRRRARGNQEMPPIFINRSGFFTAHLLENSISSVNRTSESFGARVCTRYSIHWIMQNLARKVERFPSIRENEDELFLDVYN